MLIYSLEKGDFFMEKELAIQALIFLNNTNALNADMADDYIIKRFNLLSLDQKIAVLDIFIKDPSKYPYFDRLSTSLFEAFRISQLLKNSPEHLFEGKNYKDLKELHEFMLIYNKKQEAAKVYKKMEEFVINNPVKSYK